MKIRAFYLGSILFGILSLGLAAREPLTLEERVKAQEAIERVYYNHRIWPKENPQPKPPFEKMVPKEVIEAKVTDYLKKCSALDQFWQRPIVASQLQAEMDRMAKGSKDPATLNELFAALNNDPYLIAECLARPVLADRLVHNWYANDERFHGEAREKAKKALKELTTETFCSSPEGQYSKMTYKLEIDGRDEMKEPDSEGNAVNLDEKEFARILSEIPDEGKLSGVIEKNDCFVIVHTTSKNGIEIKVESLTFAKMDVDEWLINQEIKTEIEDTGFSAERLFLPPIPEGACTEGWDNGILDDVPDPRDCHTAVWTGTEMIVWGGYTWSFPIDTGGCYNPSTDSWTPTSKGTNCPSSRYLHTAIWTGTEMIIWGGSGGSNTGGKYDPLNNTWTATSTETNCPPGRKEHTAVWTGTEMIIWGGCSSSLPNYKQDGGCYNPSNDTWMALSTGTNCPSARKNHTAVWTNSEMIIWGGYDGSSNLYTGGKYNISTDSWTGTSTGTGCPSGRYSHTAVWSGTKMIIWGGLWVELVENPPDPPYQVFHYENTGAKYDPATDSWTATSTGTDCPSARKGHTAVWCSSVMIVWGGYIDQSPYFNNTGGRYNPSSDAWTSISTTNCPAKRGFHTAVWTGTEMIVWGGVNNAEQINTGGRYRPATNTWVATSTGTYCPEGRYFHTAVWTGSEMIIWGGYYKDHVPMDHFFKTGGMYSLSTDSWTATSAINAPSARYQHTAIWTGSQMIVWGGQNNDTGEHYMYTGGKYSPSSNSWSATSTGTNCPTRRGEHAALWTGTEMIVWGGYCLGYLNTGGKYDPLNDSWNTTSTGANCPIKRRYNTAIWTGNEMIIWGGYNGSCLNTGGKYDPVADSWTTTATGVNCPTAREYHTAVWTGKEMIVWGGYIPINPWITNTGGRYDPVRDTWTVTDTGTECPTGRWYPTSVWNDYEMIVWGGRTDADYYGSNSGGIYDPTSDRWATMSTINAPAGRVYHTALWTDKEMIIWGGGFNGMYYQFQSGGIYYISHPPSSFSNNLSGDNSGCSDSGILIEWSTPSNWGDGSSGSRTFDILRDGTPAATGLSESTFSYTDTTGDNGVSYLYQVRANNGCGLSTTTTGMSAADNVGTTPDEVSNFDDVYSWDAVSGADGYRLYKGTLTDLPNLMTLTTDGCLRYEGTATSYDLSSDDPSEAIGNLYWYLVTAYSGACEGTAGEGTGFTRILSSSGVCP